MVALTRLRPILIAVLLMLVPAACDSVEDRIAEHYERGEALLADNMPEKAIVEFRNVLALDQSNVPALFGIATALERTGDLRGAIGHLLRIVELDPGHVPTRVKLAQAMMLAGDLRRAAENADAAYAAAPDDPDVLATRAAVALRSGNSEKALEMANTALALSPDHAGAGMILIADRLANGDHWEAQALTERFLKANPEDLTLNLVKLQMLEQDKTHPEALRRHLEHLVGIYPGEPAFRLALARFQQTTGDSEGAIATMRTLADEAPENTSRVLQFVGFLGEVKGDAAARAELEARIKAAPDAEAAFPYHAAIAALDMKAGDQAAGEARLDRLIADDDLDDARVARARLYRTTGEPEKARALVDSVLENDAKNVDALATRAALELDGGDPDAAIVTLRSALNEAPQQLELLRLSTAAYDRSGSPELALESLAAAVRASNYEPALTHDYVRRLLGQKQQEAAAGVLEEAIRRHPTERPLYAALADIRLAESDWTGAEAVASRLAELGGEPSDTLATRISAEALRGQGRLGETIDMLEGLAKKPEARASALGDLVRSYVDAGRSEEAIGFLDGVIAKDPKNVGALILRAALHISAGETEAAEAGFRAAVAAAPEQPAAHLALVRFLFTQNRLDDVRAALEAALETVPEARDFDIRLSLARLQQMTGDYDGAIASYRTLYDRGTDSILVANNLASLLSDHHADDPASLALAVEAARRLAGSDVPQFQDTHGWTLHLSGDHEAALRSLLPAVEALPDNPWVQYHIGMTYAALDEPDKAREHLQRARELGADGFPARAEVEQALDRLGG